jgi:hypothetical protein
MRTTFELTSEISLSNMANALPKSASIIEVVTPVPPIFAITNATNSFPPLIIALNKYVLKNAQLPGEISCTMIAIFTPRVISSLEVICMEPIKKNIPVKATYKTSKVFTVLINPESETMLLKIDGTIPGPREVPKKK